MIHTMLPSQYLSPAGGHRSNPHRRLMAAVLQTVVDDCRGSLYRRARGWESAIERRDTQKAAVYMASTDRRWPFSFENLCDALGLDAGQLRSALNTRRDGEIPSTRGGDHGRQVTEVEGPRSEAAQQRQGGCGSGR